MSFNMMYAAVGAAACALVILVLVLLVVRSRGRRTNVAPGLDAGPVWTSLADPADVGVGETTVVDAGDAAVAAAEPTAARDQPMATLDLRPGIDPAVTLVTSLLQHSGELDPEESRRLELFRPERIIAAVEALTPGMTGRSNESKRSRLTRIRQYAASLTPEPIDEPAPADGFATADPVPVRPPEAWGADAGETTLPLDPELSLLDAEPIPTAGDAPAAEDAPAEPPAPAEPTSDQPDDDKRATINELARLATPEALTKLQDYLDDPDSEIQLYALSAAERLLGD